MLGDQFLKQVPDFLAAFEAVKSAGHFDSFKVHADGYSNSGIRSVDVQAVGYIPSEDKFKSDGIGALVDPNSLLAKVREFGGTDWKLRFKNCSATVKYDNWPRWDRTGNNIVGSKGRRVELSLHVTIEPARRKTK